MPDEDPTANPQPQPEPQPEPEPAPEVEVEGEPEPEPEPDQELWDAAVPDLPMKDIDPKARQRVLLNRLAAQAAKLSATETSSRSAVSTDTGEVVSQPSVPEVPDLDEQELLAAAKTAIDEGDSVAFAAIMQKHLAYTRGMGQVAGTILQEHASQLKELSKGLKDISVPTQLRMAVAGVAGASEADIPAARKLMDSGEVKTAETALKLVAYERQAEIAGATPKRTASEEAKRKAKALQAAQHGKPSVRSGEVPVTKIPRTVEDIKEVLRAEAEASK